MDYRGCAASFRPQACLLPQDLSSLINDLARCTTQHTSAARLSNSNISQKTAIGDDEQHSTRYAALLSKQKINLKLAKYSSSKSKGFKSPGRQFVMHHNKRYKSPGRQCVMHQNKCCKRPGKAVMPRMRRRVHRSSHQSPQDHPCIPHSPRDRHQHPTSTQNASPKTSGWLSSYTSPTRYTLWS